MLPATSYQVQQLVTKGYVLQAEMRLLMVCTEAKLVHA